VTIEVTKCSDALGAQILNLDLSQGIDAATQGTLRNAWADGLILLIRGQRLSDAELVRFTSVFGRCDASPPNEAALKTPGFVPQMPEVAVISNVVENGEAIGSLANRELVWHTDMSYNETPADGCALYALEVPESSGDTSFLNMYRAYETLDPALQKALIGKQAIHNSTYTSAGTLRKGSKEVDDVRQAPGARHPMLRTHPVTGRTALFLGRRVNSYILGLPVDESEALLDTVWAHATQEEFAYRHRWLEGDIVLWDNRCVMHRREPFDNAERRVMHRTQLTGATPYYQAEAAA
jgi:taurine dioxygenase